VKNEQLAHMVFFPILQKRSKFDFLLKKALKLSFFVNPDTSKAFFIFGLGISKI